MQIHINNFHEGNVMKSFHIVSSNTNCRNENFYTDIFARDKYYLWVYSYVALIIYTLRAHYIDRSCSCLYKRKDKGHSTHIMIRT